MTKSKDPRKVQVHPLFRPVFDDWRSRADVLSALPDAPVVPDPLPSRWTKWLRPRFGRLLVLARLLPTNGAVGRRATSREPGMIPRRRTSPP
jgi:hypothetical protein